MLRRTLVGLVAIGILASFMGIGGFSLFTDTADNGSNAFTSGSVEISTSPASAFLTMSNMAPLDSVTAELIVTNDGTLPMRYSMTTATTDDGTPPLDDTLTLVIRELGTNCTTFDGSLVYGGTGETLADGFIGDPTPGGDTGDRPLNAGAHEHLCFKVTLPDVTGPMSAETTATFTFDAEQTTNNP
jgi:hypothetical protein